MKNKNLLIGYLGHGLILVMIAGAIVLAAKWHQVPQRPYQQRPIETTWRYVATIDGKPVECVRRVDHINNTSTTSC